MANSVESSYQSIANAAAAAAGAISSVGDAYSGMESAAQYADSAAR